MDQVVQIIGLTMMLVGTIAFGASVTILVMWYVKNSKVSSTTDNQTIRQD